MALRRASHVAWRRVGDETVLIHLKTKKIYVLNPSGGFFWHGLDGGRGSRALLDELALADPLPGDANAALDSFFDLLETADLVEAAEANEPSQPTKQVRQESDKTYPLTSFIPPEMVWQEQLRNFGQSCARDPGEMPTCDTAPTF
jgi:hypothetical protein